MVGIPTVRPVPSLEQDVAARDAAAELADALSFAIDASDDEVKDFARWQRKVASQALRRLLVAYDLVAVTKPAAHDASDLARTVA